MNEDTNIISQWRKIKEKNIGNILFFRLGDFYEVFEEDAIICSKVLGLTLTRKSNKGKYIHMAGIPHKSANTYLKNLIKNNYNVAICEQVDGEVDTDLKIIKREVVQVITNGTVIDDSLLDSKKNNFINCIFYESKEKIGIASIDILDGKRIDYIETNLEEIIFYHSLNEPSEIISNFNFENIKTNALVDNFLSAIEINSFVNNIKESNDFDMLNNSVFKNTLSVALTYIKDNLKRKIENIDEVNFINHMDYVFFNKTTKRSLEINESNSGNDAYSLVNVMDYTSSDMGSRLLKYWINTPLGFNNYTEIINRQNAISDFLEFSYLDDLKNILSEIDDFQRSVNRCKLNFSTLNDFKKINSYLKNYKNIVCLINDLKNEKIIKIKQSLFFNEDLFNDLSKAFDYEVSSQVNYDFVKNGYDKELDDLRIEKDKYQDKIFEFEEIEKERLNIGKLKVIHNEKQGYLIEIPNDKVKNLENENYFLVKTLKTTSRFQNEYLINFEKNYEVLKKRCIAVEKQIFYNVNEKIKSNFFEIKQASNLISELDVLMSLSLAAKNLNLIKPCFNSSFEVVGGRHIVLDKYLTNFVPNDLNLYDEEQKTAIITGANMGGKSTFMRQNAIIALLAHIGSFVPAELCNIPILDGIFTRIGSSDNISEGLSTFMTEMTETTEIIKKATNRSLVILDELGRGTSTEDGFSLACSILNYLHKKKRCFLMFSTHYNNGIKEFCEQYNDIVALNTKISFSEKSGDIIFEHKIIKGFSDCSYGIPVAKLAGLNDDIIKDSYNIRKTFFE